MFFENGPCRSVEFKHFNNTSSIVGSYGEWGRGITIEVGDSAVKTAPVNSRQHFKEVYDIVFKTQYTVCMGKTERAQNSFQNKTMLVVKGSNFNSARARGIHWDPHGLFCPSSNPAGNVKSCSLLVDLFFCSAYHKT